MERVEEIKRSNQNIQERLETLKAQHNFLMTYSSEQLNIYMHLMDLMKAHMKETGETSPAMDAYLENIMGNMENDKAQVERESERIMALIHDTEKQLEDMDTMSMLLLQQQHQHLLQHQQKYEL